MKSQACRTREKGKKGCIVIAGALIAGAALPCSLPFPLTVNAPIQGSFFFSPFFFCLCAPAPFFLLLFLGFRAPSFKTGTLNPFKNARSPLLSNCFLYSLQINEVVLSFSYDPFFFFVVVIT